MANFSIEADQFADLQKQLQELAGLSGVIQATEEALLATDDYVTAEVDKAVANSKFNFNRTGKTKKTIDRDRTIEWEGTTATAKAGFKLTPPDGSLTSVYLMYGTPHIRPDTNLKNAAKGEGIHKSNIQKIQQEAFNKKIKEVMNND